jgi:hypothetical protein
VTAPGDAGASGEKPKPPWVVKVTTVTGRTLLWHKNGRLHVLSPDLGPLWVASFRPELFDVCPDGRFVPKGEAPEGMAVAKVEIEPAPGHG